MMSKVKAEIAVALGIAAGVGEAIVATFPSGSLHDVVAAVLPVLAALGIRSQVIPVDKVVGDLPGLLPLVTRLEHVVAGLVGHKPVSTTPVAKVTAIVPPADKPAA